jgi:hypothetical protein
MSASGKPDNDGCDREQGYAYGQVQHGAGAEERRQDRTSRAAVRRAAPPVDCRSDLAPSEEDGYYGRSHEEPELHALRPVEPIPHVPSIPNHSGTLAQASYLFPEPRSSEAKAKAPVSLAY